jgi:hypothetical protein
MTEAGKRESGRRKVVMDSALLRQNNFVFLTQNKMKISFSFM